jgi:hypothetical protein
MPHKHVRGKIPCSRPDDDARFNHSVDNHDLHLDGHVGVVGKALCAWGTLLVFVFLLSLIFMVMPI